MTCRPRNSRTTRHRSRCAREPDVLAVRGELDIASAPRLVERLSRTPSIRIIDLSGVSFIDPAGLRILVNAVRAHPALVIRAASASVRRLFAIAGFDDIATLR
jgi:anti-anti-sigma factor